MSDLNHGFDISNGIAATKDIIRVISFPDYDRDPWESDYSQIGCYKKDVGWGECIVFGMLQVCVCLLKQILLTTEFMLFLVEKVKLNFTHQTKPA